MNGSLKRATAASLNLAITASLLCAGLPTPIVSAFVEAEAVPANQNQIELVALTAESTGEGVRIEWRQLFDHGNLGFNLYRSVNNSWSKLNREIIPGGVFQPTAEGLTPRLQSLAFVDPQGDAGSTYLLESVSTSGEIRVTTTQAVGIKRKHANILEGATITEDSGQTTYLPANEARSSTPDISAQWPIAGQAALKIGIKREGWFRVTHEQMLASGFNPAVSARNLRLLVDGSEVPIHTSRANGTFGTGDYFEFFGRGLDTATSDTRTYYLIAGTEPGKRVIGDLHTTRNVSQPTVLNTFLHDLNFSETRLFPFLFRFLYGPSSEAGTIAADIPVPKTGTAAATARPRGSSKKRRKIRAKKSPRRFNHAVVSTQSPSSFINTVERKDRLVHFVSVLNGDAENYFGRVISGSGPVTLTLDTPHPQVSANSPARIQIALQGVGSVPHQVDVRFNNVLLGTLSFFGLAHPVQNFDLPVSLLQNGANSLTFTSVISTTSIVDYVRLTYPRALRANNNQLRLNLRPTQSARVEGFSVPGLKLLDVSDPSNVRISAPIVEASENGYAAKIPATATAGKSRLLHLIPENHFESPATLSLNQPSSLNLASNGTDLLIIAHKSLLATASPLVTLRQGQGMSVTLVDVEDVYDEFDFGSHGPFALRRFLSRARTTWTKPPTYVLLLGDSSHDPRNYEGKGDFDLVPTKLVDATYNETSSDDWLSDFNDEGLPEIATGRIPARTPAEANLMISKIVNFSPSNVPQSALLVADDPTGYYFNFEQANDEVQALLPSSMTVQRINRRTDSNARANVISHFNAGQSLVNYTGHGNVDTWSNLINASDAMVLTNGNKLPFVMVMDCLNGYFQDPTLAGLAEAFLKAPNGGAVAAFASSGLTLPDGPHAMATQLYILLYSSPSLSIGEAARMAKAHTTDIDVRRTWILFGDPCMKIR
ncbi:MAG TPA: C25 family cysteine peptidase [Pyrinomonadaceae bacterium]|nr:C25 family cysteine peptidase [Pyrinomonadaceae bacterium]